jgi:hypothetical protein
MYKRNRILYIAIIILVTALGLYTRKIKDSMPEFFNLYLGDILWALMIFMIVAFIFRNMITSKVALIGLIFCYLVELSQLYHAEWIDNIRKMTLGGLVLGYVFSWKDLIAYAIGISIGIIVESIGCKVFRKINF